MKPLKIFAVVAFALLQASFCFPTYVLGQEKRATSEAVRELEDQQKQLAIRFSKLEELFIRMSELEAAENPTRAGLLLQAAQMSKQLSTLQRLSVAGDLLSEEIVGVASKRKPFEPSAGRKSQNRRHSERDPTS
jgi:hypothetical protein